MSKRLWILGLAVALLGAPIRAQVPPPPAAAQDYSQEAIVVEQSRVAYRFENDGTSHREMVGRIKVQSDAGVLALGQLVFGYNAATERMTINFVRVHKANGAVVLASPDSVQDLSSPVEREAPVYTDFRQKHVTVPSLRPGETVEFSIGVTAHTALAAGHFWMEHDFHTDGVALDDQLEVDVPASRAVTLKTRPGYEPVVTQAGGRRIYRWKTAQKTPTALLEDQADEDGPVYADVRLTTFQSWADVGGWYAGLERAPRASNAQLRAKAQELVKGKVTDLEKLEALYDYVALNFRYVSISLGAGRYQPRAAADVLRDQYGDCKDKHTLLVSLLETIGLKASTVLINSEESVDPEFPSPSQFDHVITKADVGGQAVWLDVTTEVAPFRVLSPELRKKQALVVTGGTGRLEETPPDPPMTNSHLWTVDGKLGELGTLTAHIAYSVRGDVEVALRTIFRNLPSARWKDVIEELNAGAGVGGEIANWKVSDPAATRQPFVIEYDVTKISFVDWTKKSVTMALPLSSMELPDPEGVGKAIELGSPEETRYRLTLELGPGYTAQAPVPVDVTRDYGDYRATYSVTGRTFTAERALRTRSRELVPERASDYAAFRRIVSADDAQRLALDMPVATTTAGGSADLKTADLLRSGFDALRNGNFPQAIPLLKRVVASEPRHSTAWRALGIAYAGNGELNEAVDAFKKQIEVNPFDETAYNALGAAYTAQQRYADAEAAFLKQLEVNPLDSAAPLLLGQLYLDTKRFAEAVPHLERASARLKDNASAHVSRGYAYLNVNRNEDAIAAFDRAVELSPTPGIWNNVAYYLAEKGVQLDRAQQYAESAVTSMSVESRNFSLARLTDREVRALGSLASYWDTLGWVAFARGDLTRAEQLLSAAWRLSESGAAGTHLAQTYEKQGRRDLAVGTYAVALGAERPDSTTRERLRKLASSDAEVETLQTRHRGDLAAMRTVPIKSAGSSGAATFYLLLGPQGVEEVMFGGGDDALRAQEPALRTADFKALLPVNDVVPAKLVRQGRLTCTAASCEMVLLPLAETKPMQR